MRHSVVSVSLLFLAVHLVMATLLPLFDDEAYYALWARDLALGYYDHPPMIAYMIRMGTTLLGETPIGIRLFPVTCFVASGYLVGDIVRRISGGAAGLPVLSTTLFNLGLLVFALGSFATPDAPSPCSGSPQSGPRSMRSIRNRALVRQPCGGCAPVC